MAEERWRPVALPGGDNPDKTDGDKNNKGLIIYVTDGSTKHELIRVAFARRNGKNPKVPFKQQLKAEMEKADAVAEIMNKLQPGVLV